MVRSSSKLISSESHQMLAYFRDRAFVSCNSLEGFAENLLSKYISRTLVIRTKGYLKKMYCHHHSRGSNPPRTNNRPERLFPLLPLPFRASRIPKSPLLSINVRLELQTHKDRYLQQILILI
jgi:hypothetical protein